MTRTQLSSEKTTGSMSTPKKRESALSKRSTTARTEAGSGGSFYEDSAPPESREPSAPIEDDAGVGQRSPHDSSSQTVTTDEASSDTLDAQPVASIERPPQVSRRDSMPSGTNEGETPAVVDRRRVVSMLDGPAVFETRASRYRV